MSMISDINSSLQANPGLIFSVHKCNVEALKPPVHIHWDWTLK